MTSKDYLSYENNRNRQNMALYTRLLKAAFPDAEMVLIGHHLEYGKSGSIPVEIPSADCALADHYIMTQAFGYNAVHVMQRLVAEPVETRDALLEAFLNDATFVTVAVPAARGTSVGV